VTTYAASTERMESRNGVRIIPDLRGGEWAEVRRVPIVPDRRPAGALDHALDAIAARYGKPTSHVVAMQLEYPRR
jgi:hypothetical protein